MKEVRVLELLPNGLTKVDLDNEEKRFLFPKGFLEGVAQECLRAARLSKGLDPDTGLPSNS